MATIDDFGDTAEPLNAPVLGGPSGWAAAVRDAINGKVSKLGDTINGVLSIHPAGTVVPLILQRDERDPIGLNVTPEGGLSVVKADGTAYRTASVASPTLSEHAATKAYVDSRTAGGVLLVTTDAGAKFTIPHGLGAVPRVYIVQAGLGAPSTHYAAPGVDAAAPDAANLYGFGMYNNAPYPNSQLRVCWWAAL